MFTNVIIIITCLIIGNITTNENLLDTTNYIYECSLENPMEGNMLIIEHLTPMGGVYYFGSQKETYYNLDMSSVVEIAHNNGIEGEYYIREDGCKMLGDYIMIAANQNIHPYGSLVETSLGTGIVVDTGGFAVNNPLQIDIAVSW